MHTIRYEYYTYNCFPSNSDILIIIIFCYLHNNSNHDNSHNNSNNVNCSNNSTSSNQQLKSMQGGLYISLPCLITE